MNEVVLEQEKPFVSGHVRKSLGCWVFLFALVGLLGGIVQHYSCFSTGGKFLLHTEETGVISGKFGDIEYQRLLIRNRYPFELTMTVRLCQMDSDTASTRFYVLDQRSWSFMGTRSLYSGSFETRANIVTSGDGRFQITDRSAKPEELINVPISDAQTLEENLGLIDARLHASLVSDLRKGKLSGISNIKEDRLTYGKEIIWNCSLPGEHPDKVLVVTLRPRANYGR